MALAFKTDITRVATFMYGRDNTNTTHPASGVTMSHHGASHHSNKPEAIESFARINAYFVMMYSYLLEKLRSTPDGDGNLLDHSVVLIGSSMANANGTRPCSRADARGWRHVRTDKREAATSVRRQHASFESLVGIVSGPVSDGYLRGIAPSPSLCSVTVGAVVDCAYQFQWRRFPANQSFRSATMGSVAAARRRRYVTRQQRHERPARRQSKKVIGSVAVT